MLNIPTLNLGIIAVSRDCFIRTLSERRRAAVVAACDKAGIKINEIKVTVENEKMQLLQLKRLKSLAVTLWLYF